MSPEAQRIAIAEACGWRLWSSFNGLWAPPNCVVEYDTDAYPLPDYLNDLNAMHEAEKVLLSDDATYSQRNFYASLLGSITLNDNGRGWQPLSNDDCFPILHATAAQRAEAFLRTLNLWTDDQ